MECFRKSEFQGLRDLGGKSHSAESDASAYLTNNILMSRKVDLLEINKEQLARNGHEMTELLDKVALPTMTSPPQALASVAIFDDTDEVLPAKSREAFATVVGRSPRHSRRRPSVHGVEANKRQRTIKPGTFQSLVEHAIGMHLGFFDVLPDLGSEVPGDVSENRQTLYRMALSRLHDGSDDMRYPSSDSNVPLKDAFVALSGIWNMFSMEANKEFNDHLTEGRRLCLRKELEVPDEAFASLIEPLVSMAEKGSAIDDLIEKVYELQAISSEFRRSLDALKTIFKHAERPLHGKLKDPAEADAMSLWSSIFREQLPAKSSLALNLGEQGCAAAKLSSSIVSTFFDTATSTRKCDCILSVDGLEVANFEAKKGACSELDLAIQLRKNIKINKSILLQLERYGVGCPPILCIHGTSAVVVTLQKFQDIWVAGPACRTIALPESPDEVPRFLRWSVHVLFNLLRHYDQYSREIRIKKLDYEYERRMASEVNVLQPQEQEPMKGLEWESIVLHTPTKQTRGRRPSLMERLQQVGSEETNNE